MSPSRGESERRVVAVRGATTVEQDDPAVIVGATSEMLTALLKRNGLRPEDVVSLIFTVTEDLSSGFPAPAARAVGLTDTPLLCAREIPVEGSLARCIRVLMHFYTSRPKDALEHVYLKDAVGLRAHGSSEGG
jgi:chorismate mutase